MKKKIVLRSEIVSPEVSSGDVCPICGGAKSRGAASCRACFIALGGKATIRQALCQAVQAVVDTYAGIHAADAGKVARGTVEKPVFSMVRVPKDAEVVRPKNPEIKSYLRAAFPVRSGVVETFVFSETGVKNIPLGTVIAGIVSFRVRKSARGDIAYLRVQHAPGPAIANSQLFVTDDEGLADRIFRDDLPDLEFCEPCLTRRAFVGFKDFGPVVDKKTAVA